MPIWSFLPVSCGPASPMEGPGQPLLLMHLKLYLNTTFHIAIIFHIAMEMYWQHL
jgi:hypothetical protein